jgi:hypothetical protein
MAERRLGVESASSPNFRSRPKAVIGPDGVCTNLFLNIQSGVTLT